MIQQSMICLSDVCQSRPLLKMKTADSAQKEDGGMKSSMMQNPSDPEATFRSKAGKEHRDMLPILKNPLEPMVRL